MTLKTDPHSVLLDALLDGYGLVEEELGAFSVSITGCDIGWRVAIVVCDVHGGTAAVEEVEDR